MISPIPAYPAYTVEPTGAPAVTIKDSLDTLAYYPLTLGNTWVYSATYYGYYVEGEGTNLTEIVITSTFIITDRVIATEIHEPYFAAQMQRTSLFTAGVAPDIYGLYPSDRTWHPASPEFRWNSLDRGIVNPASRTYWDIIDGSRVYYQDELDLSYTPATAISQTPAYYYLPFSEHPCWFARGDERRCREDLSRYSWMDFYYVKSGPTTRTLSAGTFTDCYTIGVFVKGGGVNKHFCLGVGLVGFDWEAHWQGGYRYPPIGHKAELINYSLTRE
ncbi:MAG: hypothetical protein KKA73_14820 [Chloroflexi bacterium]|nr:hypothetical protein [Chloroflexota bacterium]MBU1748959.1 hypothetical protein [Chloroflexota bacterium]